MPIFRYPFFYNNYYSNYYNRPYANYSNRLSASTEKSNSRNSLHNNANKYHNNTQGNSDTLHNNIDNLDEKNNSKKSDSNSDYFFELFSLKLYFDDILLICLIFFLYQEGVKDDELFISLILLLLS